MKIAIEKVREGVKITIAPDPNSKPISFVVQPGQVGMLISVMQTAMTAAAFKFELQL